MDGEVLASTEVSCLLTTHAHGPGRSPFFLSFLRCVDVQRRATVHRGKLSLATCLSTCCIIVVG